MTGDQASNWEFFKDSWKNIATATKLDQKEKQIVAATLLSIMGKEFLHVCKKLPMTVEERQDADVILTKLDEYFVPKRNTIYERYVFNCSSQKHGKTFDQFLTELRKFAATCQFGTFEDEMLRDRIVTGLRDREHRERVLRETTLTLQKTIDIVVQMKWQQINDSKWNKLTLFISSTGTKLALATRIHARILTRSKTANIA